MCAKIVCVPFRLVWNEKKKKRKICFVYFHCCHIEKRFGCIHNECHSHIGDIIMCCQAITIGYSWIIVDTYSNEKYLTVCYDNTNIVKNYDETWNPKQSNPILVIHITPFDLYHHQENANGNWNEWKTQRALSKHNR